MTDVSIPSAPTLAQVLGALEQATGNRPKKVGDEYSAICPAHNDERASLSLTIGRDGMPLLHCHAGCDYRVIYRALGLDAPRRKTTPIERFARREVARYVYRDESGTPLYVKVRYEPKSFECQLPDGTPGINGVRRVLYRLPETIAAAQAHKTVYVVEGEKDAETLAAWGLDATTNMEGAGKWDPSYSEALKGCQAIVIPDNDNPGRKHAFHVTEALDAAGIKASTLTLPDAKDVTDWAQHGGTRTDLEVLVARLKNADGPRLPMLSQADAMAAWDARGNQSSITTGIAALDSTLCGGLPVKQVTSIVGYTGSGKSELARQFRRAAAAAGHHVIHVDVELGTERIFERDLAQDSGIPAGKLRDGALLTQDESERLASARASIAADRFTHTINPGGAVPTDVLLTALDTALRDLQPASPTLIVLDSAQRLAFGSEGDSPRMQLTNFLHSVEMFAHTHDVAIALTVEQKRGADGGTPTVDDALTSGAESRAIEFVSDVMLVLSPTDKAADSLAPEANAAFERRVEVILPKNRRNGPGRLGEILVFEAPCWRMHSEPKRLASIQEDVTALLADGKPRTLNTLEKDLRAAGKGRKRASLSVAVTELQRLGGVSLVEGKWALSGSSGSRTKVVPERGNHPENGNRFPSREPLGTTHESIGSKYAEED